jgi:lipopolysaccharide/colanic/teichoic acid biosynthesis glycosyltransferase
LTSARLKGAGDRLVAALALLATAPILAVLAILVKVTSSGPVLYVSRRLGLDGRPFQMRKFRSMVHGAPQNVSDGAKTIVTARDPRLTIIGPFLRLGFDELPQLWDVLVGHMSIVGPRPDLDWMDEYYTPEIRERLTVRPGITGLAQVCNARELTTAQTYALDVWYARHQSAALDLRILVWTIPYVFGRKDVAKTILQQVRADSSLPLARYEPLPFRPS